MPTRKEKSMRKYIIDNLENTSVNEHNFNHKYHEKYISKTGEVIKHNYKSESFKSFICLGFDKDEKGFFTDVDWFHVNDLRNPQFGG